MNESSNRVRSIFVEAVETHPPERRASYLDEACGEDLDLRARVEALLEADARADSLLDGPPPTGPRAGAETADATGPAARVSPARIGPYRLLEPIGEGGMGTVFLAEQTAPVQRRVALKVIKPGMDTGQVIARFEAERQALALMDHPNIAKVLDAGATPEGRPFFVMELVGGLPLNEYCDRERLPVRERLELFVLVCRAVQHAHQKGIIHRDLKPSNVLVAVVDGVAVPKVIDFGVAKATGQSLTDRTLFTGFLHMVGTPLYMSPEQADLSGVDADTRSDIYALGVLLYELLTGTTPLDRGTLQEAAFDEVRRLIREQEPPTPSTRLSGLGETLAGVAASRRADPRQLGRAVRGELDWIVMKCLEKDRARRYETANALARDLVRYLADEPVEACPPSSWYRLRKFAHRYRAGLAVAGLVALSIVGGGAASAWQAYRATVAERQIAAALEEAERGRAEADVHRRRAEAERDRADRESALAERRRILSDRHLHAALLREVRQAIDAGQWERAQDLLDAIRPTDSGEDPRGFAWHYLRMLARREVVRLRPQSSVLWGLAQAADGGRIAYATEMREIIVHDLAADRIVARLGGSTVIPSNLDFSPDGRWLVSGGSTQHGLRSEVRLWDLATETPLADLDEFDSAWVHGVRFAGKGRILEVLAVPSGSIHAFHWYFDLAPDPARPVLRYRLPHHWSTAATPGGEIIASFEPGVFVRLDLIRGETTGSYPFVHEAFHSFAVSPDGRSLVYLTTHDGGQVVVLDLDTGDERGRLPLDGGWFTDQAEPRPLLVSAAAEVVVLVRRSGTALAWDRCAGTIQRIEPPGSNRSEGGAHVDLSPDGRLLALSTWGDPGGQLPIVLYEVSTGATVATYPGQPERYRNIKFAADGKSLLISSRESVKRWRFDRSGDEPPTPGHDAEAWAVAFSPDGCVLATGSDDVGESRTIRLWDAATGSPRTAWTGGPGMVSALAFAPDGRTIASAALTPSDNLWLWEAGTGEAIGTFDGHTDRVRSVAFAPDGTLLASGGSDRTIRLWDPVTRREVGRLLGHADTVRQVAFSPDGKTLASASNDATVRLWDVAARRPGPVLHGPGPFTTVAFSPAGDQLAAAGQNGVITLIDPDTGQELGRIHSEVSELRSIAYAPDGRALAAAGMGAVIRLWDVLTGQELLSLDGHAAQINALAFSPDGRTLASCSHDGEVRLWGSTERE